MNWLKWQLHGNWTANRNKMKQLKKQKLEHCDDNVHEWCFWSGYWVMKHKLMEKHKPSCYIYWLRLNVTNVKYDTFEFILALGYVLLWYAPMYGQTLLLQSLYVICTHVFVSKLGGLLIKGRFFAIYFWIFDIDLNFRIRYMYKKFLVIHFLLYIFFPQRYLCFLDEMKCDKMKWKENTWGIYDEFMLASITCTFIVTVSRFQSKIEKESKK